MNKSEPKRTSCNYWASQFAIPVAFCSLLIFCVCLDSLHPDWPLVSQREVIMETSAKNTSHSQSMERFATVPVHCQTKRNLHDQTCWMQDVFLLSSTDVVILFLMTSYFSKMEPIARSLILHIRAIDLSPKPPKFLIIKIIFMVVLSDQWLLRIHFNFTVSWWLWIQWRPHSWIYVLYPTSPSSFSGFVPNGSWS